MTKHEIAPRRPQLESDWGEKSSSYVCSFRRILFFREGENAILQIIILFFREINFWKEEILFYFFREIKSNIFFQIRPQPQATELSL